MSYNIFQILPNDCTVSDISESNLVVILSCFAEAQWLSESIVINLAVL